MTNLLNKKAHPANSALQLFFDEANEKQHLSANLVSEIDTAAESDVLVKKISDAERLLEKANLIADLLNETPDEKPKVSIQAELHTANAHVADAIVDKSLPENEDTTAIENKENAVLADTYSIGQTRDLSVSLKNSLPNRFQVLLFEIESITIAIPLVELGGIHLLTKVSKLGKQPSWCKGVMVKGSDNFTCVDASSWLVPKRHNNDEAKQESKFGIQLGKTDYLLCCNSINTTVEVSKEDIKWRENKGSRPWLAGLLKKEMCALVDCAEMVQGVLK